MSTEVDGSVAIFAVSYDPVSTLYRFANSHDVTYPLLSDVGSIVIERLGLLNTTLAEERAAYGRPIEERHRGIPYPGTFMLDEDGVLTLKRFEISHRIRPTGRTLLRQLTGDSQPPAIAAESASPGVQVAAWLDTDVIYANQLQEVHVRFVLDDGVHLYTEPAPEGYRSVSVSLSGDDRLRPEDATLDQGTEFTVSGLDETFYAVEAQVDMTLPFIILSNRDTAGDATRPITLAVDVRYQACTSNECYMPEAIRLELPLTEEPNPGYETSDAAALSPLALRRLVEGPKTTSELLKVVNDALHGVTVSESQLLEVLDTLRDSGNISADDDGLWSQI